MNNIQAWHKLLDSVNLHDLEKLLDKHAVFIYPLVFKPQKGRKLAAIYLKNAYLPDCNKTTQNKINR